MTKQEALQELMDLSIDYGTRTAEEIERLDEAVDMAIKALRADTVDRQTCDDAVSRQQAIDAVLRSEALVRAYGYRYAADAVRELPAVQPQRKTDEWCPDCKEYDQEKHCCPRFNRVIRQTLSEHRKTGKWIDDGTYGDYHPHHAWHCSECEESVIEIDTPWFKFCPNCGADMRDDDIPIEYFESGGK